MLFDAFDVVGPEGVRSGDFVQANGTFRHDTVDSALSPPNVRFHGHQANVVFGLGTRERRNVPLYRSCGRWSIRKSGMQARVLYRKAERWILSIGLAKLH